MFGLDLTHPELLHVGVDLLRVLRLPDVLGRRLQRVLVQPQSVLVEVLVAVRSYETLHFVEVGGQCLQQVLGQVERVQLCQLDDRF